MELALGDGAYVSNRSRQEKWGTSIIDSISEQLRRELPGLRGFSARSIRNMRTFYEYWKQFLIWQPSAAKLQLSINQDSIDIECFSLQKWSPVSIEINREEFLGISFSHHLLFLNRELNCMVVVELKKGAFYIASVDGHVNAPKGLVFNGQSDIFFSGYKSILSGVDFQKIKYFAPVDNHIVKGYYQVLSVEAKDMSEVLAKEKAETKGSALKYGGYDKPIRICLKLGKYTPLSSPFTYGLDSNASKGIAMTRTEFKEYCNKVK